MSKASFTGFLVDRYVSIAIKAYSIVGAPPGLPDFATLHKECLRPVNQLYYCQACNKQATKEDRIKGFPVKHEGDALVALDDRKYAEVWIPITDEEWDARIPDLEEGRPITVHAYAPFGSVSQLWQEKAYYLVPDGAEARLAYSLWGRALREERAWAVVQYVSHSACHLGVVAPIPSGLALLTVHYPEYIRTLSDVGQEVSTEKLASKDVAQVRKLVQSRTKLFEPDAFHDLAHQRTLELVEAKVKQRPWVTPELPKTPERIDSLMEAIIRSIKLVQEQKKAPAKRKTR